MFYVASSPFSAAGSSSSGLQRRDEPRHIAVARSVAQGQPALHIALQGSSGLMLLCLANSSYRHRLKTGKVHLCTPTQRAQEADIVSEMPPLATNGYLLTRSVE